MEKKQMLVSIIINDKKKYDITIEPSNNLQKVVNKLKKDNYLSQTLRNQDITLHDSNKNILSLGDKAQQLSNINKQTSKLIITVPQKFENSIGLQKTRPETRIVDQKEALSKLFKTLKKVFVCIQKKKFDDIDKLKNSQTKNPQLIEIFCSYAHQFRKYTTISEIYQSLIDKYSLEIDVVSEKNLQNKISTLDLKERDEVNRRFIQMSKRLQLKNNLIRETKEIKMQLEKANREIIKYQEHQEWSKKQRKQMNLQKAEQKRQLQAQVNKAKEEINKVQDQNKIINEKLKKIQVELDFKSAQLHQIYGKEQLILSLLQNKQYFKKKLHQFLKANQLIKNLELHELFANSLFQHIAKTKNKKIKSFQVLFKYQNLQRMNWKESINSQPNLLLIAKTVQQKFMGGFSSASMNQTKRGYTKQQWKQIYGFIFNNVNQQLNVFKLKNNFPSIQYDEDYILFGNQQISIQKSGNQISSLFGKKPFYYQDPKQLRSNFLSDRVKNIEKIELKMYVLLKIQFYET